METRHAEVMSSLNEVKASQKLLEDRVSDMNVRLAAVESKADALEGLHDAPDVPRLVAEAVRDEHFTLQCRLDDYEDRSRRDNLILYGIPDSPTETWTQSEQKVRSLLVESFSLQLPEEAISKAHRLGTFVVNKCRPIVVKFISLKIKDNILSQRSKLKGTRISLQEDLCKATRLSRKKLSEFGKASGKKYNLRYNKLFIDNKCYAYYAQTDSVCEVELPNARSGTDAENVGQANDNGAEHSPPLIPSPPSS